TAHRSDVIRHRAIRRAELGESTIAAISLLPDDATTVERRAIVLAAADHLVGVGGVQANALELDGAEVAIQVGPRRDGRVIQTMNAAIIAIQQKAVGVESNSMVVWMWRSIVGGSARINVCPGHSTIGGSQHAARSGGACDIHN